MVICRARKKIVAEHGGKIAEGIRFCSNNGMVKSSTFSVHLNENGTVPSFKLYMYLTQVWWP
jgi:hypothetical protein